MSSRCCCGATFGDIGSLLLHLGTLECPLLETGITRGSSRLISNRGRSKASCKGNSSERAAEPSNSTGFTADPYAFVSSIPTKQATSIYVFLACAEQGDTSW